MLFRWYRDNPFLLLLLLIATLLYFAVLTSKLVLAVHHDKGVSKKKQEHLFFLQNVIFVNDIVDQDTYKNSVTCVIHSCQQSLVYRDCPGLLLSFPLTPRL